MALLGVQADMQCKSFPGHFSSMDFNMDTSGCIWPFNNADTIRKSGQYCNGTLLQTCPSQHRVYTKEVLQQTMLKHQAIFRNQIYDLHRLYWRQKELMDDMKLNKLENHHLTMETLQSNPHLSQKSCDFAEKNCNVLTLPRGDPGCSQLFSTAESSVLLSSFYEGKSTHADFNLAETKFSLKDCQLESKCKNFGTKILNVDPPADEYVDSEEEKLIEIVSEVSGCPEGRIPEVHMSDQQTYNGNASFNSVLEKDCLTPDTMYFGKNCLVDLNEPLKLEIEVDSSVLKKDLLTRDTISFRKNYLTDLNEPLKLEKEADHMSTYLVDLNQPMNPREEATRTSKFVVDLNEPINLQEEVASRSSDIPSLSIDDRELTNQDLSKKSDSGLQVLPTDVMQNTNLKWDLRTCSDGLQMEKNKMLEWPSSDLKPSMDVTPANDMDYNFMSYSCTSDGEKKIEDSTERHPWLKTNSVHKGKCCKRSELSTQIGSSLLKANSASIFDVVELKKVEASYNSSIKRLLGGEQLTSIQQVVGDGLDKNISGFGVGIDLNSCIDEHESSPTPALSTKLDFEAPASPENKESSPPRGESEENQVDTPSQMSGQEGGDVRDKFVGTAVEVVLSGHEDRDAQEDLLGNLVEAEVSGQDGGDVLVTDAAKAIISISSFKVQTSPEITTCGPSKPRWSEDLYLFASIVSQVVDNPNSEFGVVTSYKDSHDNKDCLSNGLDYFEAMTLKLTETKVEEWWCKSNDQKYQKEEEMGAKSLPSQQRRGRMRRGRQLKNFQSEILPNLASLSRYEVTADLQTIEGLIEAADNSLKPDSSRIMGRNARTRGGRRSCNSKVSETKICTQSKLRTRYKEKGNVESKLIGWGNITRGRRGRRCPARAIVA